MIEPLRILMSKLIDYAGVFPPAGLPMKTSVRNFSDYQRSKHWDPLESTCRHASLSIL